MLPSYSVEPRPILAPKRITPEISIYQMTLSPLSSLTSIQTTDHERGERKGPEENVKVEGLQELAEGHQQEQEVRDGDRLSVGGQIITSFNHSKIQSGGGFRETVPFCQPFSKS